MSIWILALLDDIAMLADDTATITKISIQKTAGILWDDLAVNAKQASGFSASREIPVLWRITKWALLNKIIILPFSFLLTAFAPVWVIPTILVFGWCYLAFEGMEKIHEIVLEKFFHVEHNNTAEEIIMTEDQKVKSAIFTDFILSIEIIVIALSTVLEYSFMIQTVVVSIVAIITTFWVYGVVTFIVRLDDIGFYFIKSWKKGWLRQIFWNFLVALLPIIIRILTVVWTWAMLLVAGGIFTHNIPFFHHLKELLHYIPSLIFNTILWFILWYILVILFFIGRKVLKK